MIITIDHLNRAVNNNKSYYYGCVVAEALKDYFKKDVAVYSSTFVVGSDTYIQDENSRQLVKMFDDRRITDIEKILPVKIGFKRYA